MPNTPIAEAILEEMRTTIDALASGSTYFYSWGAKLFEDFAVDPREAAWVSPTAIIRPDMAVPEIKVQSGAQPYVDIPMVVQVYGLYHEGSGRSAGSATEKCCRMEHDLVVGLIAGTSYTRGSKAITTKLVGIKYFPEEFDYLDAVVECRFEVLYRRRSDDPASQA